MGAEKEQKSEKFLKRQVKLIQIKSTNTSDLSSSSNTAQITMSYDTLLVLWSLIVFVLWQMK